MDHAEAYEHNRTYNTLDQKADPRPAVGECRVKSLQEILRQEHRRIAKRAKHLKVGMFFLLLASVELDNAALQTNGYGMRPIVGCKLRQNIGEQAHLAEHELSSFIAAVKASYSPEQAKLSAEDWIEESELMDSPPRSELRN